MSEDQTMLIIDIINSIDKKLDRVWKAISKDRKRMGKLEVTQAEMRADYRLNKWLVVTVVCQTLYLVLKG
jgi:hypothetical protein